MWALKTALDSYRSDPFRTDLKLLRILAPCIAAVLVGCAGTGREFVQGSTRILPPIIQETNSHENLVLRAYNDGGTRQILIHDARGRAFHIFIDHRIDSPTPGKIYLNAYPGESNRVRVLHQGEFKQKVGDVDRYH